MLESRITLQDDIVDELMASRRLVGELLPIIKDQHGRILNGRHRKKAGWTSEVTVPVKDDLDYFIKRLHYTAVQRTSSMAEHAEAISLVCGELERTGMTSDSILPHILNKVSPFKRAYTYDLVPDRYKRGYHPRQEKVQQTDFPQRVQVVGGLEISPALLPSERNDVIEYPCSRCGCPAPHTTLA